MGLSDCVAIQSNQKRENPGNSDVPSKLWHLQERRQLFGSLPEKGAKSGEFRLWHVKDYCTLCTNSKQPLTFTLIKMEITTRT